MSRHSSRLAKVDPEHPDRWWTRFVFWHCVIVLAWIGLALLLTRDVNHRYLADAPRRGAHGHQSNLATSSLGTFHHFVPIPWPAFGVLFLLLAVGLLNRRTRPVAYFVAAVLSITFTVTVLIYTYIARNSTNPIVVPLSTLAPDALLAGLRYSVLPAAPPRRERR